ncbi:MAG: sigma-54-dependent Fis family transcriptional regulator, partial [Acidobacteria bacterium]|nr:sigma-54-dependent Fis family transcriptional regulator [Acidobacteriota bacterium]
LYYRLKVIEVTVPALRERRDEIPHLTDFFIARYSKKYNRPAPTLSDEVRQLFLSHDWPGNIRELENMIKRLIILQDEQMIVRELTAAASRTPAYAPALAMSVGAGAGAGPPAYQPAQSAPPAAAAPPQPEPLAEGDELEPAPAAAPPPEEPRTLADIARAAAMKAERAALEQTLDQVRWNRRKAAQLLGVSYKTLLNKIKECGISQR